MKYSVDDLRDQLVVVLACTTDVNAYYVMKKLTDIVEVLINQVGVLSDLARIHRVECRNCKHLMNRCSEYPCNVCVRLASEV